MTTNEAGVAQATSSNGQPEGDRRARDPYVDVGKATRESIDALLTEPDAKLTRQARAHLAVLYFTTSYSRQGDHVTVAQIAAVARIPSDPGERHLRRALHELHDLGVIVWEPTKGGPRKASWVSIAPEDQPRPLLAIVHDEEPRPDRTQNPGHFEQETPADLPRVNGDREGVREEERSEDDVAVVGRDDLERAKEEILVFGLGYMTDSQLDEFARAYVENSYGFLTRLEEALTAQRPVGLLTKMIREGGHFLLPPVNWPVGPRPKVGPRTVAPRARRTGWRFVRGTHSGNYVRDPEGVDQPPPAFLATVTGEVGG